jgi:hypothetical protein
MKVTCLRQHLNELRINPEAGEKRHAFQVKITSIDPLSVNAKCLDGCGTNAEIIGEDAEKMMAGRGHVDGEYTVRGITSTCYDSTVFIYSGA